LVARPKTSSGDALGAAEQRQAASDALELLEDRLGPDLPRFLDVTDTASFFAQPSPARVSSDQPADHLLDVTGADDALR
jgi:hypothetical protein